MATRREARERALGLCYEAEQRDVTVSDLLGEQVVAPDAYAVVLVEGVAAHAAQIDELLVRFSQRWALDRMPAIDRALLRIGCFELGWQSELPTAVIVNEAVELAHEYSTDDSARFVNGLLSRVAEELRPAAVPE
jgi:N utilization substance protein B